MHKYLITNAIDDRNVLTFEVDYKGIAQHYNEEEIKLAYDTDEFIRQVVYDVGEIHDKKTQKRNFNAMFATGGIDRALKYYEYFKIYNEEKNNNNELYKPLKVTCVFSVTDNEENESIEDKMTHKEGMANIINDYNKMFIDDLEKPNFDPYDSDQRGRFIRHVAEKVKRNEIDILIVSDMFLTGFDSKCINTFYYDKFLKMHNLIQAFSRTNRVSNDISKVYGNIVSYINNKDDVDEAIALFSDGGTIPLVPPYHKLLEELNIKLKNLKEKYPSTQDVNDLSGKEEMITFASLYREILRKKKIIESFREFEDDHLFFTKQDFEDYNSAYFEIERKLSEMDPIGGNDGDEAEIAFDFEIELISQDRITYDYIKNLLAVLKNKDIDGRYKKLEEININEDLKNIIKYLIDNNIDITPDNLVEERNRIIDNKYKEVGNNNEIDGDRLVSILKEFSSDTLYNRIQEFLSKEYSLKLLERRTKTNKIIKEIDEIDEKYNFII